MSNVVRLNFLLGCLLKRKFESIVSLPPTTVGGGRQCFHEYASRILSMGGVGVVYPSMPCQFT